MLCFVILTLAAAGISFVGISAFITTAIWWCHKPGKRKEK